MSYIIAEIGCNHRGELETAKEMIRIAKIFCGVDCVKFQKRTNKELLTPEQYNAPHPCPWNSYGDTYGAHREYLEFTTEQHRVLQLVCEEMGMDYSTSVWDVTAAREMIALQPTLLKVPSACNTDEQLLQVLAEEFTGEIHISLGMTTHEEEARVVDIMRQAERLQDVVLYACTSTYPAEINELCLGEITRLRQAYEGQVKAIGFSGHHAGIASDVAALTLGATVFERHYTLNRTWKGTDHAASLEPDGLRRVCRDLKAIPAALSAKPQEILPCEEASRKKMKRYVSLSSEAAA
jgi:N-acetylneuraminate synthase